MEVCPHCYFWWCGYSWSRDASSVKVTKLFQGSVSHEFTAYLSCFYLSFSIFLSGGLSSFNPKGISDIYAWPCTLFEGFTYFCTVLTSWKLSEFQSEIQTGACNRCKRVLEAVKFAYANETKQKSLSLPRKMALITFGELLFAFLTKVNMLHLLYLTDLRCFHVLPIKQNCLQNTYPGTRILMTQVLLYLLLLLGLIWNCIIFM